MGVPKVDESQLSQIGDYVKSHMSQWMKEQNIYPFPGQKSTLDPELLERIVRVEEGLKHQIELTRQGFESMDKRFADTQLYMDKRFEAIDKRFGVQTWLIGIGFTVITVLMSLYRFLG